MKKIDVDGWPAEPGRYVVGDKKSCVAVCTLSEVDMKLPMDNIAITGKCVTENLGMEKIIKNVITNPNIRFLILCCKEPEGHYVGQGFLCLKKNGIDSSRKIIGARGAMPFLKNVNDEQIKRFNEQIELIDTNLEDCSPWFIDILVNGDDERANLAKFLGKKAIVTRPFYPAIHSQPPYSHVKGQFDVSDYMSKHGLWLPSSSFLSDEDIEGICAEIKNYFQENKGSTS